MVLFALTPFISFDTIVLPRKGWDEELTHALGGLLHHFRKGVMALPLTFTFHVGKFTVTITIRNTHRRDWSKARNEKSDRHSAK